VERKLSSFKDGYRLSEAIAEKLGSVFSAIASKPKIKNTSLSAKQKDIQVLYEEFRASHSNSIFGKLDPYQLVEVVVGEACKKAGKGATEPLVEPFVDAVLELATDEGFWGPADIDWSLDHPLSEQIKIKTILQELGQKYTNAEVCLEVWIKTLSEIFVTIFSAMPEVEESRASKKDFSVALVHLLDYPKECVEKVILSVFSDSLIQRGLFSRLRKVYDENAFTLSGMDQEDKRSKKEIIYPTDSNLTGKEFTYAYLKNTVFEPIFSSPYPFSIPESLRFEHCHILAGTGYGKTQLLQKLMLDDIKEGRGFCAIDSQGDLIRNLTLLSVFDPDIQNSLADKLIIIDPTDTEYPVCLNMFAMGTSGAERLSGLQRELIVNGTVDLYSYMFGALFGAELTQRQGVIFTYIARLMMEIPDATVQTLRELMENGKKFMPYMEKLEGSTGAFFRTQFFSTSFSQTKKQVLTRLWGVLSNATLERMFSNTQNKVDLSTAINEGKIILINTSKDLLQKDGSAILGRFFIALLGQAVLKRTAIPEKNRKPFFIYIDEAHEYFDYRLEDLLNQARKYKVGFTLAHQNLEQLGSLKATINSSTSIKLVGGVSSNDAIAMAREMRAKPEDIESVRKGKVSTEFACYLKNVANGVLPLTIPFGTLESEPILTQSAYSKLIEKNRERYCNPRSEVSFGSFEDVPFDISEKKKNKLKSIQSDPSAEKEKVKNTAKVEKPTVLKGPSEQKKEKQYSKEIKVPTSGKGGAQHRYLQNLIKKIAQERGFKATVEQEVLSGAGSVDVAIKGYGEAIAVEISVTTDATWECQNISKCLASGYDKVIIVSSENKHLNKLRSSILNEFNKGVETQKILFMLPDSFIAYLDQKRADSAQEEKTVRGYKVRVKYSATSPKEEEMKKEAIAKIILESMRKIK
jgi:hypothetical protein